MGACSTVSIPVLRHETGETSGQGKLRFRGRFETSKAIVALPDPTIQAFSTEQETSRLQSLLIGIDVRWGLLDRIDLKLDVPIFMGGGGWRFAGKYQIFGSPASSAKAGNFALAAMAGYGKYGSTGGVTYTTADGETDFSQSFSATSIDAGVPVSFRIAVTVAVYSGIHLFLITGDGLLDTSAIETSEMSFGANLGFKVDFDPMYLDLEGMLLQASDPFLDETGFNIFFGLGFGAKI